MRGALSGFLLLLLLPLGACETPPEALVQRCRRHVFDPVECELSAQLVREHVWASVNTNTKNAKVRVTGSFTLDQGHAAIVLFGCDDGARSDVKPGAPTKIDCVASQNRHTFQTGVDVYSFGGDAKGLRGKLSFVPQ